MEKTKPKLKFNLIDEVPMQRKVFRIFCYEGFLLSMSVSGQSGLMRAESFDSIDKSIYLSCK